MKKVIYIFVWALCFGLSACRSHKEAAPAVAGGNPYLMHYLSAAPDSLNPVSPAGGKAENKQQELDGLREKVNPNKTTGTFGDTLRDILESIFSKKH